MDSVDRGILHALRIDGRVPFRAVGEVLGISENTVARRYRRLRAEYGMRVVGAVDGSRLGHAQWTIRLRCTPDAAESVANALAARDDTHFVYLLSGGTEVSCTVQTRNTDDQESLLLHKLPRTSRIVAMSAHLILGGFKVPDQWQAPDVLTPDQIDRLRPELGETATTPTHLDDGERALLTALSRDGRGSYAELATATGWSEVTVRRRMDILRRSGILHFRLDIPAAAFGFGTEARLWIGAQPSAVAAVGAELARHPEVAFVGLTTGPTNLVAAVNCRDAVDLGRYLTERIAGVSGVATLESAPIIRTVKRVGALLV
ncbi:MULTISPECIES: Lrp/AsnC family transcriptional regulator [unclassified Nocardia]|uniref:Lrp/AsnC family transcriptional regulator n=1 Tax=unclassified Nocardia TaxID=2637762 RepID=UPI001CE4A25C|nr:MULTISPECIES: Lrp/AsnC family transcriptional regulator [unclassified Nocardia]